MYGFLRNKNLFNTNVVNKTNSANSLIYSRNSPIRIIRVKLLSKIRKSPGFLEETMAEENVKG
jgi:hypothetical protein